MPPHTKRLRRHPMFNSSIRTAIATGLALAALPASALAIPNNGGNGEPPEPIDHAPTAKFTMSPNPALAGSELVIAQKQRAFPGNIGQVGGGDVVTFNGSASSDDHGIDKYEWDLDGNGTYEVSGAA